jgi:aminomethyltransferase
MLAGKRVPREGYTLIGGGRQVGTVTSGTFSPTLEKPIAMGYVEPDVAAIGTSLEVDIRGRMEPAHVVELPFYKRTAVS